jgi:hypothetical protein
MTTDKTPPDRIVTFDPQPGGILKAVYVWKRYRFLMSDGSTVDVTATRDDSDLRAAVLAHTGAAAIAGVVTMPPSGAPVEKPKVPAKTVGRKRA